MPLILPSNSISAGGYEVANSLRFNSGSSDYLSRTYGTPTNNLKYTKSFWVKRSALTDIGKGFIWCSSTNSNTDFFYFDAVDKIVLGNNITPYATAVFRDVSAWYHCVMVFDSANATANDRLILYVNGIRQTLSSTISLNSTGGNQSGVTYTIANQGGIGRYLDGYLAEICMIDGQALDPTSFGEFDADTGIWKPIDVSGLTFGNNGYYLPFENSGALGQDDSGNGNNFTVNNLTSIDQVTDTPTNNFCTLNPLSKGSALSLSNGNLTCTNDSTWRSVMSTIAVSKGKWYWEAKVVSLGTINFGVTKSKQDGTTHSSVDAGRVMYSSNGYIYDEGFANSPIVTGTTFTTNDIIGIALNLDAGTIGFYKNGSLVYTYSNAGLTTNEMTPANGVNSATGDMNFGSPPFTIASGNSDANGYGNFEYAVPSGYYALCTKNLAEYG